MSDESNCPVTNGHSRFLSGRSNRDWWPNALDLKPLHQDPPAGNPMGEDFDYAAEFETLDLDALKKDVEAAMTDLAGLVAGRLRPLRAPPDPDGVAQRRAPTASATAAAAPAPASSASRP